jgi:hypothetical protein
LDFSRSTDELLEMGVKTINTKTGEITLPASFSPYLDRFERSQLEFEWEADYGDNSTLPQFVDDHEFCFKDINLSRLKKISFISNFNWQTDNEEKRVIVTLNIKTGEFTFMNGFASQELRAKLLNPIEGEKKLILFARKRNSSAAGEIKSNDPLVKRLENEAYFYNRFVLGYEVSGKGKRAVIIMPNGNIEFYDN